MLTIAPTGLSNELLLGNNYNQLQTVTVTEHIDQYIQ